MTNTHNARWYERNRARRLADLYRYCAAEDDPEFKQVLEQSSFSSKHIEARYEFEKALDPFVGWFMERIAP